jgi:GT2 family glycosyltransferase
MNPKISIIIVNWNGWKDTVECLNSVKQINYPNYETIIVDNGSCDNSIIQIKKKFPDILLLETKKNLGFAGGNNVGISYALKNGAEFFLLLNNDTIVNKEILNSFINGFYSQKKAGILGAKILCYKNKYIDHFGGFWNSKIAEFVSQANKQIDDDKWSSMKQVDYVSGCAFFIKKSVIEKIGLLEEDFFLIWEETDYCYRAKKAGFEIWAVPTAKVWHKISSSFSGGHHHMHYYWWRNRLLWIKRNCSKQEKKQLYKNVIFPEIIHIHKLKYLKSLQYLFLLTFFYFFPKNKKIKKQKLLRYKAGCKGIKDYYRRKFGKGPKWLSKKL